MKVDDSGRRWARFALIFGAAMSILGNETHTVLTPGHLGIAIRMVLAFIWPVGLFVAVEVLVRVNWRRKFIDYAGRAIMMIPVSMVAAVVSYQHLHALMLLGGEDHFSAAIGPLAIDGLMLGGTVALLAIRAATLAHPVLRDPWDVAAAALEVAPTSPAPVSTPPSSDNTVLVMGPDGKPTARMVAEEHTERAPRVQWDPRKVAEMSVDGRKRQEIADATGASVQTVDRFRKVAKVLQDDPRAAVDPAREKLRPEYVTMIRELVGK